MRRETRAGLDRYDKRREELDAFREILTKRIGDSAYILTRAVQPDC